MTDDINRIIKNSGKAELIEALSTELENFDKVIVVLVQDKEVGRYSSLVMTLGLEYSYEAYGLLEVGKQDLWTDETVK